MWELCGLTEAQCAVVRTVYRNFVFVDLVFYVIWQTGFTPKDCVCCVGMSVTLCPLCHKVGSPVVCIYTMFHHPFNFHLLY